MANEKDLEKTKEIMQEVVGLGQAELEIRKQLVEYNEQLKAGAGYFVSQEQRKIDKRKIVIQTYKKELEELKKLRKIDKEHEKHSKEQEKLIKNRLNFLERSTKEYKKQEGIMKKMSSQMKELGDRSFTGFISMLVKGVTALDNMTSAFGQATGQGSEYDNFIKSNVRNMKKFIIGNDEASRIIGDLYDNLNQFYVLTDEERTTLLENNSVMHHFGVSSQDSAQGLDILTKSLKFSSKEAAANQQSIVRLAKTLQIAPKNMIADFNKAAPTLAKYGKQSIEVFKKLQIEAKSTGVSMNSLLGITQQFDTFEGAAEAAGQLNAILGGGLLNSTELLMADEAERIKLLKEAVSASGKSWESMNRFEKQAIASAAGINDMNEATRMFGEVSEKEMEKAVEAGKEVQDSGPFSKEEVDKQILGATTLMQRTKVAAEAAAGELGELVFEPLMKSFDDITKKILGWLPAIHSFFDGAKKKMHAFLNWEPIGGYKVSDLIAAALPAMMLGGGMSATSAAGAMLRTALRLPKKGASMAAKVAGKAGKGAARSAGKAVRIAGKIFKVLSSAFLSPAFTTALAVAIAGTIGVVIGRLVDNWITKTKIGNKEAGESFSDFVHRWANPTDYMKFESMEGATTGDTEEQRQKIRNDMAQKERQVLIAQAKARVLKSQSSDSSGGEESLDSAIASVENSSIVQSASNTADNIAKVILNLDGKELANAIIPLINKSLDLTVLR